MTEEELIDYIDSYIKKNGKKAISGDQMNIVLKAVIQLINDAVGVVNWGDLEGTLSDQIDLQAALNAKQNFLGFTPENSANKGSANGYAPLNSSSKIDSTYLPSYVDDVIEVANFASLPGTGESGKIYVTLDTNLTYRWSGSAYVEISASLALGETSSTAYRGDRGKTAYDHSQTTGNPHGTTATDVDALKRDGSNANADVDLGNYALNAKALKVNGTGGNGKIGLKHQSADATASANETIIFAGSDGEPRYKNDSGLVAQFASRAWVTAQGYQQTLTDANFGMFSNGLTAKTAPVDADTINLSDSADSNKSKKLSFTNLKSFLKTYFDTIYTTTSAVASQITTALISYVPNTRTVNGKSLSSDITLNPADLGLFISKLTTPTANHTGTLTRTILVTHTLSANTLNGSDIIEIANKISRNSSGTSSIIIEMLFNSTNTLSGATSIASYSMATGVKTVPLIRQHISTDGTTLLIYNGSGFTDEAATGVADYSSYTLPSLSGTIYFFIAVTLGNTGDSCKVYSSILKRC